MASTLTSTSNGSIPVARIVLLHHSLDMLFFFIKPSLDITSSVPYAGGEHGFLSMSQALAAAGHTVHLLYSATKSQLLYAVIQRGSMAHLSFSNAVEGLAVWSANGITHHVSLSDVQPSTQQELSTALAAMGIPGTSDPLIPCLQRLLHECSSLVATSSSTTGNTTTTSPSTATTGNQIHQQHQHQQQKSWIVLDADGSQEILPGSSSSLLEACSSAWGSSKLLLLVQNIHFLPLGDQGTATRRPKLLSAWSSLGGVLCVSHFVANYIRQHAAPLGLAASRICMVHYATWGAFGGGPFPDCGAAAVQHLPWPPSSISNTHHHHQHQEQDRLPAWRPTICCLKLTEEKGARIFLHLAQLLPELHFLAVCAEAEIHQQASQLSNVTLVPPGDVTSMLRDATAVIAPSIWQEAYGMAVTDAVLRGVPVLVSNQGGLVEAALGCTAAVVPVQPLAVPIDNATGCPSWHLRRVPEPSEQELSGWSEALGKLLRSREVHEGCRRAGREAGQQLLQQQPQLLAQFVSWLEQLG